MDKEYLLYIYDEMSKIHNLDSEVMKSFRDNFIYNLNSHIHSNFIGKKAKELESNIKNIQFVTGTKVMSYIEFKRENKINKIMN